MRPGRFSHPCQSTDVLRILDPIEQDQSAAFPGGLSRIIEQFLERKLGKRSNAKSNTLVIAVGFGPLLENRRLDHFDDHPGGAGEFHQFDLLCPLVPGANAQAIQPPSPGQERFANRMDSGQPIR